MLRALPLGTVVQNHRNLGSRPCRWKDMHTAADHIAAMKILVPDSFPSDWLQQVGQQLAAQTSYGRCGEGVPCARQP